MSKTDELLKRLDVAKLGGGIEKISKQHEHGKLTARERIDFLVDPDSFSETGMLVTHQCDRLQEKYYGDGVVTGSARIENRRVFIFAQDFTVMGGSLGEAHAKKICQVMDMAIKMGSPIIGLIDSGGARIQEGLGHYGSIFYRNVLAAGVIPQISLIMGPCAGGAVYSPALSDFVFMIEGTSRMHITGPAVIKAVTGEDIQAESLGGGMVHFTKSGVAHFLSKDERETLSTVRELLSYLPSSNRESVPVKAVSDSVDRMETDLERLIPEDPKKAYNMKHIIELVVDNGLFLEVQKGFAKNIIIGFGRLNGESIGVVANQPSVLGGCLDVNASVKAARFIRFCDAFGIPIITLVDCPGYLPGSDQEFSGIIRHGAKMLYAYSEATVPRITVVLRKIYGGAMSGMAVSKYVGTDFTAVLPTAEIAIMGPEAAVNVLYEREIKESKDPELTRQEAILKYRREFANPYYAAERGWVDEVIEPKSIRPFLITCLYTLKGKMQNRPARKHGTIPL